MDERESEIEIYDDNFVIENKIRDAEIWELEQSDQIRVEEILDDMSVFKTMNKRGKYQKDLRRIFQTTKDETDRVSELPDDILFRITSSFSVSNVVNACALSRRWRRFMSSSSMSCLKFDYEAMFQPRPSTSWLVRSRKGLCKTCKQRFVKGVNQFLQYYHKGGSQLASCEVMFCLEQDLACEIDQMVTFAISVMGVKQLSLNLSCQDCFEHNLTIQSERNLYIFSSELLLLSPNKLEQLCLRSCILGAGVVDHFSSLTSLQLTQVTFGANDIDTILSSCLNLVSLLFAGCILIPILCIPSSLHRLKFLSVTHCCGLRNLKLLAKNLALFEFGEHKCHFSFSGATNLRQIFFVTSDGNRLMQYAFHKLATDLPLLETLSFSSLGDWLPRVPEHITTFSKLKQLEFYSPDTMKFKLSRIIAILTACPLLEIFYFVMVTHQMDLEPETHQPAVHVYKHLKEVYIGGFVLRKTYTTLVTHILKYGVALERLVIDPEEKQYYRVGKWLCPGKTMWNKGERERVCEWLKGHPTQSVIVIK